MNSKTVAISALLLATSVLAGTENTLSYANSHCAPGTHDEWLCAEFVARSLMAGGEFADCTTD